MIGDPFMYRTREELSIERLTDLTIAFIHENSIFGSNLKEVSIKVAHEILNRFDNDSNFTMEWYKES